MEENRERSEKMFSDELQTGISRYSLNSTAYTSEFGTSQSIDSDAVSKIFAAGGYSRAPWKRYLIAFCFGVVLMSAIWVAVAERSVNDVGRDVVSLDSSIDPFSGKQELVTQTDLNMSCQPIDKSEANNTARYGCNAVLRNGEYYGVILGWWKAVDAFGERVPINNLEFQTEGFDATIVLTWNQTIEEISFVPWQR